MIKREWHGIDADVAFEVFLSKGGEISADGNVTCSKDQLEAFAQKIFSKGVVAGTHLVHYRQSLD